jgi:hypothetical protein
MDRDDAGMSDREEQARRGDTGMIGSESEEPGPGRDTSLTDPDPVAASTDQPRGTVAMSEGDPMRTRLGSHVEGAGAIGYDVAAAEEGATQETPTDTRPGYEPERTADPGVGVAAAGAGVAGGATGVTATGPGVAAADERVDDAGPTGSSVFAEEPTLAEPPAYATEDVGSADRSAVADDPARFGTGDAMAAPAGYEGEPGGAGTAGYQGAPGSDVPATYTGEEADVTDRPEYAERTEGGDQALYQQEPQRMDRPGGGGSLFTDEEPERLDRPGPQEPGVQEGVYDQEAERARRERPSDGR